MVMEVGLSKRKDSDTNYVIPGGWEGVGESSMTLRSTGMDPGGRIESYGVVNSLCVLIHPVS